MHVPWFSLTAITALTAFFIANMRMREPPHVSVPTASQTQSRLEQARTLLAPGAGESATPSTPASKTETTPSSLIIPVLGVTQDKLSDTWGQARSEGRVHEGIDILAPQGTAVIAAADGRIVKFFDSQRGGFTIYEFDRGEHFVYYYAHLSARAPGLTEGADVRQGQTIGFVGMTGNAPVPHLHFEVERLGPEKHWWQTQALNPYPLLMTGTAPRG